MSHESLHLSMLGKDWNEILLDLAHKNECLETRIADLERKLLTAKITVARLVRIVGSSVYGKECPVCGALGDEECDVGLHG